jgi:apolipoprotein N-acyltransferase
MLPLLLAAAQAAPLQKLQKVPPEFWWKMGIGVVGLIVVVIILRKLANVNKMVLGAVIFVGVSIVGFSWIYDRNEPAWATPVVEKLAQFFPQKDAYNTKQKKEIKP